MFDPAARELRRWLLANDPHRQRYHFTAPEGWINDPNGPIYQRGTYHLFYQYRRCSPTAAQAPSGATPAPDLLHWDDWPVAMWPDRRYDVDGVYSGNTLFRFEQLLMGMANEGEWRPVLEFLSEAIVRQTGIRDYIAGEKVIQGFLAAYLSVTDYFVFRSEVELGKGHADISLEPLTARYPHLRVGYLIELKYLTRGEPADEARVATAAGETTALPGGRAPGTAVPGRPVHGLAAVAGDRHRLACRVIKAVAGPGAFGCYVQSDIYSE